MVTAIIAAAGQGKRMDRGINKVFIPLLNRPVLVHTILAVAACPEVDNLILVVGAADVKQTEQLIAGLDINKACQVVVGGSERQFSIANALKAVPDEAEIIAVHDGARPLVEPSVISQAIAMARAYGAAGVAVPVKDTIKTVDREGYIGGTPERSTLWGMQTPQVFKAELLHKAYRQAEADGVLSTDDAALVERLGVRVKIVAGSYRNIKITTPEDLLTAEVMLRGDGGKMQRVGMGYDVHQLVEGRRLILGGVDIPHEKGLEGHSDADVLLHAIKDALLGAAALGDIGRHFPDSDMTYKGASSLKLLERVRDIISEHGWLVYNVDATVVAEKPKLAPFIESMNGNIAAALQVDLTQVNVKATTTEGLGFTGRKEGIAAYAVASIVRQS